jgi:hypothetical protein
MAFPCRMPKMKPEYPLSAAMQRMYDQWSPMEDRGNDLFSNFKYSRITAFKKESGVSRRDPSKVINIDGCYHVWYTKRDTDCDPVGYDDATDIIPCFDWDLADIWHATSCDGFKWKEQGPAVTRASKGGFGDRSLTTADILFWGGKFWLYYQAFTGPFRADKGDFCPVSTAWADSPYGPWTKSDRPVVALGAAGEWDSGAIHDPYLLVYKGKIHLYYKGSPVAEEKNAQSIIRAQGVAISDNPLGPFKKHPLNPVLNSGHETGLFPFREGVAAIVSLDGPEKNSVQYAPDGVNFFMASTLFLPPIAPGPFVADAFSDSGDGRGITWGLCHINPEGAGSDKACMIARFDCDLSRDVNRPFFKRNNIRLDENAFFQRMTALPDDLRQAIIEESSSVDKELE